MGKKEIVLEENMKNSSIILRLGNKTISKQHHNKIYVDNNDNLWTFLLNMDNSNKTTHHTAEINTKVSQFSACTSKYTSISDTIKSMLQVKKALES